MPSHHHSKEDLYRIKMALQHRRLLMHCRRLRLNPFRRLRAHRQCFRQFHHLHSSLLTPFQLAHLQDFIFRLPLIKCDSLTACTSTSSCHLRKMAHPPITTRCHARICAPRNPHNSSFTYHRSRLCKVIIKTGTVRAKVGTTTIVSRSHNNNNKVKGRQVRLRSARFYRNVGHHHRRRCKFILFRPYLASLLCNHHLVKTENDNSDHHRNGRPSGRDERDHNNA